MSLRSRLRVSVEEIQEKPVSDIESETADNLQAYSAAVDESVNRVSDITDSVDEVGSDIDTLEETTAILDESSKAGGLTASEAAVIAPAIESILTKYGFKPIASLSVESYMSDDSRVNLTKVSIEDLNQIKEKLKSWALDAIEWLGTTIMSGIDKAVNIVWSLFKIVFDTKGYLEGKKRRAELLRQTEYDNSRTTYFVLKAGDIDASEEGNIIGALKDACKKQELEDRIKILTESLEETKELIQVIKVISIDDDTKLYTENRDFSTYRGRASFKRVLNNYDPAPPKITKTLDLDPSYDWYYRHDSSYIRKGVPGIREFILGVKWADSSKKVPESIKTIYTKTDKFDKETAKYDAGYGIEALYDTKDAETISYIELEQVDKVIEDSKKYAEEFRKVMQEASKVSFKSIKDDIIKGSKEEGESFLKRAIRVIKEFVMGVGKLLMINIKAIVAYFMYIYKLAKTRAAFYAYVAKNKIVAATDFR